MSNRTHIDDAARWFLRLQDDATDARVFLEWQRWMNASTAHRTAYAEIEETFLRLRTPIAPPLPSDEELAADDYDGSVSVEEWRDRPPSPATFPPPSARTWMKRYALAAGIAMMGLLAAVPWMLGNHRAQHGTYSYSAPPGERREIELPEGSRITLDAGSILNVELASGERTLVLVRGEGYFRVSKDALRPFTVLAGSTRVRAVGTAFNVRRSENRTVVAVTEGKVEVTAAVAPGSLEGETEGLQRDSSFREGRRSRRPVAQLSAGEAVTDLGEGSLSPLTPAEASLATSWLDGRRSYRNEPLRYVLADIDRYSGRRIDVADEATGDLQFTGTLNLGNREAWLKALSIALPVVIAETPDGGLSVARDPGR